MQTVLSIYMNSSGYSIAAQSYVLSLLHVDPDINLKVNFENHVTNLGVSPNRHQLFTGLSKKSEEEGHIHVYHTTPYRYRRPKNAKKCIGVCLFETINPPKAWVDLMNTMDAIVTASHFNKNNFANNGVNVPIHVIPHCFDTKMFNKDVCHNGRYDLFTFLSIGTWKKRKNWESLIKGFYDAFEMKDGVCLLVKTDKPKELESMIKSIKVQCEWRSKDTAPIYLEQQSVFEFEKMPEFMKKGDVYVSCSLGEGFNLPAFHAMCLNIPLLTTRFGGCLEYAKPEFCEYIEPVAYKTYPVMDGIPQFNNCIWPVILISEIRDKMTAMKNREHTKNQLGYDYVQEHFSYESVGRKWLEVLH